MREREREKERERRSEWVAMGASSSDLHGLVEEGSYSAVEKYLIQHSSRDDFDINCLSEEDGYAPLHYAAENFDRKMGRLLIRFGADVNVVSSNGLTPLHISVEWNDIKFGQLLIDSGANINSFDVRTCRSGHCGVFLLAFRNPSFHFPSLSLCAQCLFFASYGFDRV